MAEAAAGLLTVIAHRGARSLAPENTLKAFNEAIDRGAPWIELDVQWHAGELWVIHDDRLERTTNGRGRLADHSVATLRALDAGDGERIPLLKEAIDRIGHRAKINVELKTGAGTAAAVAELLQGCLAQGWRADEFLVSSFILPELREFKRLMPNISLGVLLCGVPLDLAACASTLGAGTVTLDRGFADPDLIADARQRGMQVYVYTVDEPDDVERLQALGVVGIFTDNPALFRSPA